MTELEKRAKEYAQNDVYYGAYVDDGVGMEIAEEVYIEATERETKLLQDRIAELEAYNEKLLDGDIEKHNKIVELEAQIEKMKCCGNCQFSESDKLNGTFCHREGCFVVASAKCKLWED